MLAQHKQESLLRQSDLLRQIDAAEEKLWRLTGADQPQIGNIDKQVREIGAFACSARQAVGRTDRTNLFNGSFVTSACRYSGSRIESMHR